MNKILSIKSVKKSEYSYIAFVGAALILLGLMIASKSGECRLLRIILKIIEGGD